MNTSDNIAAVATALSAAQGELTNIGKGKLNPHLKSRYADIGDGLEVVRPILSKHGLAVVQTTQMNPDGGFFLMTRIIHKSGEWIEGAYPLPASGKSQDIGSAITYARRYTLFALVGVAGTDEDDDGHDAQSAPVAAKRPAPKAAPAPVKPVAPAEPPFDVEESESVCRMMIATLEVVDEIGDLRDWAAKNAATKDRMTADDQGLVTDAFTRAQKRIREAVTV